MDKQYSKFQFKTKKVDHENFTVTGIFSTADEDRHGDKVLQSFDLKNFKDNPVILDSHNYDDVSAVIGKAIKIGYKDGNLTGTIQFAVAENPKAKVAFDLYAGGYLTAFSIGFIPTKFNDEDMSIIEKSELLEVSAVSVPANARALAKKKGIEVDVYEPKKLKKKVIKKKVKKVKKVKTFKKEEMKTAIDMALSIENSQGIKIVKSKSAMKIAEEAVKSIETKRRKQLKTIAEVVSDLTATPTSNDNTAKKIEYRQVNSVIRKLIKERDSIGDSFKRE